LISAVAHTADKSSSCSGSQALSAADAIDNATTFSVSTSRLILS
jgi:hypothetical protein